MMSDFDFPHHNDLDDAPPDVQIAELKDRIAALEAELDAYDADYTLCDCCGCLTPDPIDCREHTQCKSCTKLAELESELHALRAADVVPRKHMEKVERRLSKRIAELEAEVKRLTIIAAHATAEARVASGEFDKADFEMMLVARGFANDEQEQT